MKNLVFAASAHIRSVVLCTLVTFGLAACGADPGSSASTAASAGSNPLVSPNVGVIDRSVVAGNTTQGTTPASSSTTPAPTTVAAIDKGSGPVPFTPPPKPVSPPPSPKPVSTGTATLDWTP